jgi:hypothetical protein
MNLLNTQSATTNGVSGDFGWDDTEEPPFNGLRSVLLLVATSAYFLPVWLLSGFAPLPLLASGLRRKRGSRHTVSRPETTWSNTPV